MNHRFNFYSIIVPSYNRKDEVSELLYSLNKLKFDRSRFEFIIADDGSTDDTEALFNAFKMNSDLKLKFYKQKNQGPGAARNMGMSKAQGDFFIFVDSDCTFDENWLANIDRDLTEYGGDAFGGPDSFRQDFPPLLKAINYSMTSFVTTGGLRGSKGKKLAKYYPRSFNMGLSRKLFEKIGGFGSLRHGQDIEFSHRIIESGAKVLFIGDAIVFHKRRTSIKKFYRQVYNWGVARINLFKIDAKMLEPLHAAPAVATLGFYLLLAASLASQTFWFYSRWIFLFGILVVGLSAIHAAFEYKNLKMIYLVPIVMPIQILGYGMGFIFAFIYRVLFNKGEFVGFRKKYYQ